MENHSEMLKSFFIRNFRLFKKLEIKKLSRVNLFVGKNNSGKSALLEAIRLYASNGQPEVLFDFVLTRQEFWRPQVDEFRDYNIGYAIRHLFRGHELPDIDGEGLRVGPLQPTKKRIHITLAVYRRENIEEGILSRRIKEADIADDYTVLEYTLIRER